LDVVLFFSSLGIAPDNNPMGATSRRGQSVTRMLTFVVAIMLFLITHHHHTILDGVDGVIMPPIVAAEVEQVGQATWYAGVTTTITPRVENGARNVSTFGQLGGIVCVGYDDICYVVDRV
jgi:hypothetical protein